MTVVESTITLETRITQKSGISIPKRMCCSQYVVQKEQAFRECVFKKKVFHVLVKAFSSVMTECGRIRPSLQERVLASLKQRTTTGGKHSL